VPLLPVVQEHLSKLFLAKGIQATTAIEGNTLSEEQVADRIQGKLELPRSQEYMGREVDNLVEACNEIGSGVLDGSVSPLSPRELLQYNALILRGLPVDEEVRPGHFREHEVGVGRYKGAPAEDVPYLMKRLCRWLAEDFGAPPGSRIAYGVLEAVVAHLYLAWIHPFGDGNGRVARLLEFRLLLAAGVPAPAAHLLSNHYNRTRPEYYRQLDRTSRSGGDLLPFLEYALQGFVDGLREQILVIRGQQLVVHWRNFLYDLFRGQDSAAGIRRRRLAQALSDESKSVPTGKIRHLTPRLAESYAGKTDRTISRDLNHLEKMGILVRTRQGVRIRGELMMAFLPPVLAREEEEENDSAP
jgi:Fic family protein